MKPILITLFTMAVSAALFAQNPDKALSRVSYSFTHIQDTTQKDKPYTENMLLVIGKNASVYTSYDKIKRDLAMQNQVKEQLKNQAGSGQTTLIVQGDPIGKVSGLDYFFFANENKFITKERVFNNYLIEETAPKIEWKITKDTASFAGIHCLKATTHFKGRNWIAWFAPDLPFQSGPWKLNGLPGLIIEAYDEQKEVQFQFAGMENVVQTETAPATNVEPQIKTANGSISIVKMMGSDNGMTYLGNEIQLPTDAIKTTRKELDRLKEAKEKDPVGFMNAQMAGSNVRFGVSTNIPRATSSKTSVAKIVVNNPIELPETK
ncbi:MAG: GLPGLI family protein [Bacteroidota bacterium]